MHRNVSVKITIFGLTISSSWGNGHATPYRAIIRALHRKGHQIHFFEKDVPYYRLRRDFDTCSYCDLTLYQEWEQIRAIALETAGASDVVITASYLLDGQRISDEILDLPRPLRVFYDLDTPITLRKLESGGVGANEMVRRPFASASSLSTAPLEMAATPRGTWSSVSSQRASPKWGVSRNSPAAWTRSLKCLVTSAGCSSLPSSWVKMRPVLIQALPRASRSSRSSWMRRAAIATRRMISSRR